MIEESALTQRSLEPHSHPVMSTERRAPWLDGGVTHRAWIIDTRVVNEGSARPDNPSEERSSEREAALRMDETRQRSGGDLFIVDNRLSRWTGLEYLREWTDLARSFDVATGFFEISSLLALDGKWQQLEKIRILMGDQVSLKTKRAFANALHSRIGRLDADRGISCPQVRRRR